MPQKTEPVWVTADIAICEGDYPPEADTILYANSGVDEWVAMIQGFLAEGRKIALVGKNARAVADRYLMG